MIRRLVDVVAAAAGLAVAAPVLLAAAVAIRVESPGPVLFRQQRVGRGYRRFTIYKLRTMIASDEGPEVTSGGDPRITRVGRVLRRTKLDELPQLVNVLRGDMALVGPRPEVPRYVDAMTDRFARVLAVRPGVTGAAAVRYRDEEALLAGAGDPERFYLEVHLPRKIRLEEAYLERRSPWLDLRIVAATLFGGRGPDLGEEPGGGPPS